MRDLQVERQHNTEASLHIIIVVLRILISLRNDKLAVGSLGNLLAVGFKDSTMKSFSWEQHRVALNEADTFLWTHRVCCHGNAAPSHNTKLRSVQRPDSQGDSILCPHKGKQMKVDSDASPS